MAIETIPFDAAEFLNTEEDQVQFLADAMEEGDPAYIAHAIGIVARARGMSKVAQDAGLSRESLYRALSQNGDPRLSTLIGVVKAMGMKLSIAA